MNQLKALIIDDEQHCRELLRGLLQLKFPEIEITGEATDVEEAFRLIQETKPGLVFLDISMPGHNGFSLLKRFDPLPFEVIFVTAYNEFAITAIKFNALDYLLKPLEESDLYKAVSRVLEKKSSLPEQQLQIINLLHHIDDTVTDRRFAIHNGEKVKLLFEKEIIYIEADSRYCKVHMSNNEHYVTARHLKEFEDYFGEASPFIRINKTFIINTGHIKEYTKGELFIIEMINRATFDVSRRKKTEILEKLKKAGGRKVL